MLGVLVDVSGSMEKAYSVDSSCTVNVERTQAVLTTVANIVDQEVVRHKREESIFVAAFGLNKPSLTCDLLSLLEYLDDATTRDRDCYQPLVSLANRHRVSHIGPWIPKHLSPIEARILYEALLSDKSAIQRLAELVPSETAMSTVAAITHPKEALQAAKNKIARGACTKWNSSVALLPFGLGDILQVGVPAETRPIQECSPASGAEKALVHRSEAYGFAQELIDKTLQSIQCPKPRNVQFVSQLLHRLLKSRYSSSASYHSQIQELIDPIKPYIYGSTPMKKAFTDAEAIFSRSNTHRKALFLLSDGWSNDGDPSEIAQRLCGSGVTIATCFLTSDNIDNAKCLYKPETIFPDWLNLFSRSGRQVLLEMSSTMQNTHTPVSYLVDAHWKLPECGESHLFIQANSLDVVNEFCRIVVSQMTNRTCDALVHMVHKIPLATYINQTNADFVPKMQKDGTCYANAIAAVFHLAMHRRIVERKSDHPEFLVILKRITDEFGTDGANIEKVLERVCPEYRLHFRKVDERGARRAINERRPVVAAFWLYPKQWEKFRQFYARKGKVNVLNKHNITVQDQTGSRVGHAVVLMRCDPKCLTFMNSWSHNWGDGGFFRVKNDKVLNDTIFYDVYWTEQDLTPSEKRAYEMKCTETLQQVADNLPSIKQLLHECPRCHEASRVGEFSGNALEARCPRCNQTFKPTTEAVMQSLYSKSFD